MGEPTIKDYSQIELRILAHLSKNPLLSNTFTDERDIHRATAAEVFDVPFEDVTEEQRCWAKAVNFARIYGMPPPMRARQMGSTKAKGEE